MLGGLELLHEGVRQSAISSGLQAGPSKNEIGER